MKTETLVSVSSLFYVLESTRRRSATDERYAPSLFEYTANAGHPRLVVCFGTRRALTVALPDKGNQATIVAKAPYETRSYLGRVTKAKIDMALDFIWSPESYGTEEDNPDGDRQTEFQI